MNRLSYLAIASLTALGLSAACSGDDEATTNNEAGAGGEAALAGAAGESALAGAAGSPTNTGAPTMGGSPELGGAGGQVAVGAGGGGEAGAPAPSVGGAGAGGAEPALGGAGGAGGGGSGGEDSEPISGSKVLDLKDVAAHPESYTWQDFRPNVLKLFLAGAAETEHIAILWYTVTDGGVGLHYHAKTESVYVIDGSQTDAKGVYTDGTVYFNPPDSGHQITGSGGFFLLAYAAPPDFVNTSLIEAYEPIRIDTTSADLTTTYTFVEQSAGVRSYAVPLEAGGGMLAQLIESTSATPHAFEGNYLLVVKGSCDIEGATLGVGSLVVANDIEPRSYGVSASQSATCLAMGVSF